MFRRKRRSTKAQNDSAPGWDAITKALAQLHGGVDPLHFSPGPPVALGGAVDGISAYAEPATWHLVTYGLTELWTKESDDPDVSGWGYELTVRVPRVDVQPPGWAVQLLVQIAAATQRDGIVFGAGHRLDIRKPITGADDTALTAVAFAADETLPRVHSVHGSFQFLTVVGITDDELQRMKASSTSEVLAALAASEGLLITNPRRAPA